MDLASKTQSCGVDRLLCCNLLSAESSNIMDQVTEITEQSWFTRIGSAITGLFFGSILFLVGFPLVFWNEGRAVHRAQDLDEGAKNAIVIDVEKVNSNHEGKLVFLSGLASTEETLTDTQFGLKAEHALGLRRAVAMYQWHEKKESKEKKKLGGGTKTETTYTYTKDWSKDLKKSSDFKEPMGHENPAQMQFTSTSQLAKLITIGAYGIPDTLKNSLNEWQKIPVAEEDLANVPESERAKLKVATGDFYVGADPANPAVGDNKIEFERIPPGDYALIGIQKGNTFVPYATRGGRELFELRSGTHTKEMFFKELVSENNVMTWILRAVGFALFFFGMMTLFRPIVVIADVVPFLGTLLGYGSFAFAFMIALACTLVTIAIGWFTYRPLYGIALIGGALLVIFLLSRGGSRASRSVPPPLPT